VSVRREGGQYVLRCDLCGEAIDAAARDYAHITVRLPRPADVPRLRGAFDGISEVLNVCRHCLDNRFLSDAATAARRMHEAEVMAEQAGRELEELTRDPGQCKERVRERRRAGLPETPQEALSYLLPSYRFCSRKARHDDGYCAQHHEAELARQRFRERYPDGLK